MLNVSQMEKDPVLSKEERGYIAELFADNITIASAGQGGASHTISVITEVPELIAPLLGQAKLTLLAEVGNYKLWFPLEMTLDESGQFNPVLGIPEVVEYVGKQRSWRSTELDELNISSDDLPGKIELLSLSSTGMALKLNSVDSVKQMSRNPELTLHLPDGQLLQLGMEPVRLHNQTLAAKITATKPNRDALRRFLFQRHRQRHPYLYQNMKN
ncbi:MAG: hypothetical protein CML22_01020 [Rheinheimera sp.]|nr:hypothetical protein [Rheinheimera sp.]MBM32869.1 hypothetical protein [Rheinheimera sp.]HAW94540.1 hypothetical protein [Candidatus Azambacteria bacterium]|tara:strand:+ start:51169 stop:51810 length:642 start_codon:yes stop_codon:yes gene_type:complete